MGVIEKKIPPAYFNFMADWYYKIYLLFGGYGSGKSYQVGLKIILLLLAEKRKALVVRQIYDSIRDSCFDLLCDILKDLGLYTDDPHAWKYSHTKVLCLVSPLKIKFRNGSIIIFKGMDKAERVKSLNGVSVVWIEEATELKYASFKELLLRLRSPEKSLHYILTCNPVGKENWVYSHFFRKLVNNNGLTEEVIIQDEEEVYNKKCLVNNGTYYMHTLPDDNIFLSKDYIPELEALKTYDMQLYNVARLGRFGAAGERVLPQLTVAQNANMFRYAVTMLGKKNQYFGFDFGFEKSYNAVISMSVDTKNGILYIWDEIYINKVTDNVFAQNEKFLGLKKRLLKMKENGITKLISADSEDPKAIAFYRQCGYPIRACTCRFSGSRLSNTRKIKRFRKIVVSPICPNTIRELKDLTYKKDNNGNVIYDDFNIDPHTFSAIWYGLDNVTVADVKRHKNNSWKGG